MVQYSNEALAKFLSVAESTDKKATTPNKRVKEVVVPLDRPETKELVYGQYEKLRLRTNPANANSTTYDITLPYFSSGTPEEWILWRRNFNKVVVGQRLDTAERKYTFARRVMTGNALAVFNAKSSTLENVNTDENFELCMGAVANAIFPKYAYIQHRRFLRETVRKPVTMNITDYVARIIELESYLTELPPSYHGQNVVGLSNDDLMEVLHRSIPNSWHDAMRMHDFQPNIHTPQEFIEFCQRIEHVESKDPNARKRKTSPSETGNATTNHGKSSSKRSKSDKKNGNASSSQKKKFNCLLHGENFSHGTDDCKIIQAQAKNMRNVYQSQGDSASKARYKAKQSWDAHILAKLEDQDKKINEMFALVKDSVAGKRKRTYNRQTSSESQVEQDLLNFEKLTVDSDSEDSHETRRS